MSTRPTATIAHSTGEIRSSDSMNSAKVSCGGSRTLSSLNESRKAEVGHRLLDRRKLGEVVAHADGGAGTQRRRRRVVAHAARRREGAFGLRPERHAARSLAALPPASHAHAPSTHTPRPLHTGSIAAHASRCARALAFSDATDAAHSSAHRAAATPMRGPVRSAHRSTSAAAAASAASNSASHASRPADGAHGAAAGGDARA